VRGARCRGQPTHLRDFRKVLWAAGALGALAVLVASPPHSLVAPRPLRPREARDARPETAGSGRAAGRRRLPALVALRGGGGQSKRQKKKKDEEKAARREQFDIQERWKAADQATARARAQQPTADGGQGDGGGGDACGEAGAGGGQATARDAGDDDAGAMECDDEEEPALEDSDVVFLGSDEVCVGADAQHVLGVSEDSGEGAEGGNAGAGDAAGRALWRQQDASSSGGEPERALRSEKDDSTFCLPHPEAVFAVALSPFAEGMVATGGADDTVRVWRAGDGRGSGGRAGAQTESALENATLGDSVAALAFSHDGTYLAAAGMDGSVRVWLPDSGLLVAELEGSGAGLIWLEWHPRGARPRPYASFLAPRAQSLTYICLSLSIYFPADA
jgi:hypothetical protein